MSHHKKKSYNKMYTQDDQQVIPEVETELAVEEQPVHVDEPVSVSGTVVDCKLLNVREHPNIKATILCMLPVGSEVKVDLDNKYDDWFHVFTAAGQEGYCMKKFINVN